MSASDIRLRPWGMRIGGLRLSVAASLVVSLTVLPITANPFDFAVLSGTANSWLNWHLPLFLYWRFGADYAALNLVAACGARVLAVAGFSVPAAAHISLKILFVIGNFSAAVALWKLASRFRPEFAKTITILWLLSPAVIWVAAIHGQIEPLTAATTFWALWCISERRWVLAGLITGLGVGFEYVPIVALVSVVALFFSKRATFLEILRFGVALGVTIILCFPQLVVGSFGPFSFSHSLIANATTQGTGANVIPGSIWYVFGTGFLEPHWLLLLVITAVGSTLMAVWRTARGSEAASYGAAGVTLIAATILDPTTLPQFSVLVMVGMSLMCLDIRVPAFIIAVAPLLTIVGFSFSSPIYTYFEDVDPNIFSQKLALLPELPTLTALSEKLATLSMDLAIVAIGLWFLELFRDNKRRAVRWDSRSFLLQWNVAVLADCLILVLIVIWSIQPQIWDGVIGKTPSSLFDTPYLTSSRHDSSTIVEGTTVKGNFDPTLVAAIKLTSPPPIGLVTYSVHELSSQPSVGGLTASGTARIEIPPLGDSGSLVASGIGVELLVHNDNFESANPSQARAIVDGKKEDPSSVQFILPQWLQVVYEIPTASISRGANASLITIRMLTKNSRFNADLKEAPYFVAWYSSGKVLAQTNSGTHWVKFSAPSLSAGQIMFSRSDIFHALTIPSLSEVASSVTGESLTWPSSNSLFERPQNSWQWSFGSLYLIVAMASLLLVIRMSWKTFNPLSARLGGVDGDYAN